MQLVRDDLSLTRRLNGLLANEPDRAIPRAAGRRPVGVTLKLHALDTPDGEPAHDVFATDASSAHLTVISEHLIQPGTQWLVELEPIVGERLPVLVSVQTARPVLHRTCRVTLRIEEAA